jgi:predicted DCC family thiol-disulfide oxidoreductase YuxK
MANHLDIDGHKSVSIVYDGECPFCSSFVKMVKLRDVFGAVTLVDARAGESKLIQDLRARYRLDDGFVLIHDGREYYGADALEFISVATSDTALSRFLMRMPVFRGRMGRVAYPILVKGRKLALRLLRRRLMGY